MNSLFSSNFVYSFQMFPLTLFLLNLYKEVLAPQKGSGGGAILLYLLILIT